MMTQFIGVFLIFIFTVLIGFLVWASIKLHKFGLLSLLLRHKWLLGILTGLLMVLFVVGGVGMLLKAAWAAPLLWYTIYTWLIYVWIYGLVEIFKLWSLLKWEKATSLSQFMGRSRFFDELLEKSVALSHQYHGEAVSGSVEEEAEAVSDSPLEEVLDDEDLFKELFPIALRKRIKRKVIGLVVQTVIMGGILLLMG